MKRIILIAGMLLATLSGFSQTSRGVSNSISAPDRAQILLACINHSSFTNYYAANGNGAVNLVNLPVGLQLPNGATALGHALSLGSAAQATDGSLSNYFTLGKIDGDNQQHTVSLTYFYGHTGQGYKVVMVDMELTHSGNQYQVTLTNFKGDLL